MRNDRPIDNAPGRTQHLLPLITEQRRLLYAISHA